MSAASRPYVQVEKRDTLILGIGNLLYADEGFGVRAIEALHERYAFGDDVCVMDGGTQGIFLLPWVRTARRMLLFDAIDFGLPPATATMFWGMALVPLLLVTVPYSIHFHASGRDDDDAS